MARIVQYVMYIMCIVSRLTLHVHAVYPQYTSVLLVLNMSSCCCSGINAVAYAYPKVKIVTTAVDNSVNEKYHIIPGIGTLTCNREWVAPHLEK